MAQQQLVPIGFKTVQLLKEQILGIGSYGKVCKAKCDDLLCAAKVVHETLFDPTAQRLVAPQREHRLPMRRFEQECEFLSTLRHPNIIQYLGTYQDPDTGLPALLMELMDESLTHYLENSPQPIPYHIQANICNDITLALSFLHSNGIVHRDLSSNNVLLRGNVLAKVTDFGMAKLGDLNPRYTFTMCPGTDVYMPPEAVQDEPVYTEKIDCFSFGVIIVQILTRQFPNPGNRRRKIEISQPGLPSGTIAEVLISEIERRQNHISIIEPNHTLLQIALDCLKDRDIERPSAQQLCERVVALKESPQYSENARNVLIRTTAELGSDDERDREPNLQTQQVRDLQEALRQKDETIAAGQLQLRQRIDEISQLERGKREERERLVRQLEHVNRQLEESEQANAELQTRLQTAELAIGQLVQSTESDATPTHKQQSTITPIHLRPVIKLTWREGERAPCKMSYSNHAAADDSALYVRTIAKKVYMYDIRTSTWSQLPDSPTNTCPLVVVNNLLTLVGGHVSTGQVTNQLFSLTGGGSNSRWTMEFPRMLTERYSSTALCTSTALIVAGGKNKRFTTLQTVEVLDTKTLHWTSSIAAYLPRPLCGAQAAVCGENFYILGDQVYKCSVSALIQSCQSIADRIVWTKVAKLPVTLTSCVSIHGQLLTVGGNSKYLDQQPTTVIHLYNPSTDSWEVIGHMGTPRRDCIAAFLPNNQLMVVGGKTGETYDTETGLVELATIALE